jgi:cellulose biosynthesis protein BcsQ
MTCSSRCCRISVVSRSQIAVRDPGPDRGRSEPPAAADLIVIKQYNPTTRIAREAKEALESHYPEFLSDTIVRQCTDFARASSEGLPINAYAPSSKGAKDIDALITEMISARFESAMEQSA